MKPQVIAVVAVVAVMAVFAGLWGYGVYAAKNTPFYFLDAKYESLNPVSKMGFEWSIEKAIDNAFKKLK